MLPSSQSAWVPELDGLRAARGLREDFTVSVSPARKQPAGNYASSTSMPLR